MLNEFKTMAVKVLKIGVLMFLAGVVLLYLVSFKFTRTNASDSDYNEALNRMTQSSLLARKAAITACKDRTTLRLEKITLLNAKETLTDSEIAEMRSAKQNLVSEDCYFTQPLN